MDGLFLSDSEGRSNDGLFKYLYRFIFEIGKENIKYVKVMDSTLVENARERIAADEKKLRESVPVHQAGDRVRHPVFGAGTIAAVDLTGMCYAVKFDMLGTERSIRFGANLPAADEQA